MDKNKPLGEWTLGEAKKYCTNQRRRTKVKDALCMEGCLLHAAQVCGDFVEMWCLTSPARGKKEGA